MSSESPFRQKPLVSVAVAAVLLAIPYAVPALKSFRVVRSPFEKREDVVVETAAVLEQVKPISTEALQIRATENKSTESNSLPAEKAAAEALAKEAMEKAGIHTSVEIEDESGAMTAFYSDLARTDAHEKGAITRIMHYGDSVLTSDLVSGAARRRFHGRFGDAGHGFILTANAWDWYHHYDVIHSADDGWSLYRIVGPWAPDGRYGPGGVSFQASGPATAIFGTAAKGEFGKNVSRFDVYYLEQPQGGDIELRADLDWLDPKVQETIHTRGDKKITRKFSLAVRDGSAKLTLKALGNGATRVFGVVMERDEPGVVYDALGINGCRGALLGEQMDGDHWKEVMELRHPSLVVLHFGTNESEAGVLHPAYAAQLGNLISKVRAAAPWASILVLSPTDRAGKGDDGELHTKKVIVEHVDAQRVIARDNRVAFFNLFEAMGGKGTMAKWVRSNPQLGTMDLTHPTPAGGDVLGNIWFDAVLRGYKQFREHPVDAGTRSTSPKDAAGE